MPPASSTIRSPRGCARILEWECRSEETLAEALRCLVVVASSQKAFDRVRTSAVEVGSPKTGKGRSARVGAQPAEDVARLRWTRGAAKPADGRTQCWRRVGRVGQQRGELESARTAPRAGSGVHAAGHAPVNQVQECPLEAMTLASGDPG